MRQSYTRIQAFFTGDRSFTFLLIILSVYIFGVIPLLGDDLPGKIAFLLFYYVLLASSIPFLLKRNQKMVAVVLVAIPLLFLVLEVSFHAIWFQGLTDVFIILYCALLGYIILIKTFAQGRINYKRVQGAIVVYLLASLAFSLIYHSMYLLGPAKAFSGLVGSHRKEFLYFSLCTLTTDGYGDIIPVTSLARSFSNLEALIGQLYPAILIARLVSLEFYYKKEVAEPKNTL